MKKEKFPVDGYSKRQYEIGLARMADEKTDQSEVDKIAQDLRRQLSNAHAEALSVNAVLDRKRLAQEVLPQIDKLEDDIRDRLDHAEDIPDRAQAYGRAVIRVAEETKDQIISQKPKLAPDKVQSMLKILKEAVTKFFEQTNVLGQNRYGHDTVG